MGDSESVQIEIEDEIRYPDYLRKALYLGVDVKFVAMSIRSENTRPTGPEMGNWDLLTLVHICVEEALEEKHRKLPFRSRMLLIRLLYGESESLTDISKEKAAELINQYCPSTQ